MQYRRTYIIAVALVLGIRPMARAQEPGLQHIGQVGRIELVGRAPMCSPFTPRYDPVLPTNRGWTMPRVGWHVFYPALSYGAAKGLMKLGVPKKVAVISSVIGLGLLPHLRQAKNGLKDGNTYALNAPDWTFDLWNRSFPAWVMLGNQNKESVKERVTMWAVTNVALSCFATP